MIGSLLRRLTLFSFLLIAASAAIAQQQSDPQLPLPRIDETIEVTLAGIDVVVTDEKGNRIRGLTRDDFELIEGGDPRTITNFTEYAPEVQNVRLGVDAAPEAAQSAQSAAASVTTQPRTIVLFLEPFVVPPFSSKPLFAQFRDTVRRMVRPGDAAAIITWADAVIVRQDFTDDVEKLIATLNKIETESTGVRGNPANSLRVRQHLQEMFEGSLAIESFKEMDERNKLHWEAVDLALFQLFKIRQKTFALQALMQRMSAYEGKKLVLFASQRFGEHAGAEFFGGRVPGQYRALLNTERYREQLIATANAYNISIYPLFVEPVPAFTVVSADMNPGTTLNRDADMARLSYGQEFLLNELHSLEAIARETGGMMQWHPKDVAAVLPKIAEDLETYYSLGWRVTGARTGNQKIVVKTKNPAYTVRTRREYAFRSDDARMQDRVVAQLFQNVAGGVIPVEAKLGRLRQTGRRRWAATLQVRIPINALTVTETDNGPGGEFSVYVAPGAVFGLVTDVQRRAQTYKVDLQQLERARKSHFTYEVELKIDHLVDRVSVGVFDETSKEFGLLTVKVPERERSARDNRRVSDPGGAERGAPPPLGPNQGRDGRRQ